jgi:phosphoesterase RecJ-like protein
VTARSKESAGPSSVEAELDLVAENLRHSQAVILTTHRDADGDGLGAEAALTLALGELGKDVVVLNDEETPAHYRFLEDGLLFQTYRPRKHDRLIHSANAVVLLDAGDSDRAGRIGPALDRTAGKKVVIDHHPARGWADIEAVDTEATSTTELVLRLFDKLRLIITPRMADALYTGAVADTDSFRNANTTERAHTLAARLVSQGARPERVSQALAALSLRRLKLEADFLADIHTSLRGRLIWGIVDQRMLTERRQTPAATEGFVDRLLQVEGAQVAALYLEEPNGVVRISLRSKDPIRVDELAQSLGGGGHRRAAGARFQGSLQNVVRRVVGMTRSSLMTGKHERRNRLCKAANLEASDSRINT